MKTFSVPLPVSPVRLLVTQKLMRGTVIFAVLLFTVMAVGQNQDETAIRNILEQEVAAWNKGDAQAYSQHFAPDGTFTNIRGMFFTGHQAFLDRHEEIFKGMFRGTQLRQEVVSLRFVRPDTAVVETLTWVWGFAASGPPPDTHLDAQGRLRTRLLQTMVKDGGEWKIAVYHNVDVKPDVNTPEPAPDVADLVKQGRKLSDDGKHDEALALFRQALEAKPDFADAHLAMGVTLDLKGEYEQGRKHIAQAIELAPAEQKPRAWRTMGMAYAFVCQPKEAEKYHKQAFDAQVAQQKYVDAAGTANELARVLLECNDIAGAERWYKAGYENALKDTKLSEKERALWDFRWHHAQARLAARRGKKSEAKKHVAEARAALDKAQNKDQEPYFPYLTGYVAFYGKDYKTAITELQKANQNDPFILALLAQSYEKLGERAKAQELYRRILTFNNHNPTNAYARPLAKKKLGT